MDDRYLGDPVLSVQSGQHCGSHGVDSRLVNPDENVSVVIVSEAPALIGKGLMIKARDTEFRVVVSPRGFGGSLSAPVEPRLEPLEDIDQMSGFETEDSESGSTCKPVSTSFPIFSCGRSESRSS